MKPTRLRRGRRARLIALVAAQLTPAVLAGGFIPALP